MDEDNRADSALDVVDNRDLSQFEAGVDGALAFSTYRLGKRTIAFLHTEVPEALRGRGIGEQLVRAALDSARARGLLVIPNCPYVAAFLKRHPEYDDIVLKSTIGR